MDNDIEILFGFWVYSSFYRLMIIMAGLVSIYLGYRLFLASSTALEKGSSEVSGEINKGKFTFKNLAPGTCFALFGASIILLMIWKGSPEYEWKRVDNLAGNSESSSRSEEVTLKGGDPEISTNTLTQWLEQARQADNQGNYAEAELIYRKMLKSALGEHTREIINDIAWLLHRSDTENNQQQALHLAQTAIYLSSENPQFWHTLASIQCSLDQNLQAQASFNKARMFGYSGSDADCTGNVSTNEISQNQ